MAEEFPFRYVPPVDPNLGRRFGRYVVRVLLGRGGMGAAYLAEHEAQAHVKCVIKFVLAELVRNPMVISRYKTETEAVSRLKHDNIVKLQDFGVLDDGQLFMCFEYIEGKSLDRYVVERGGRLDVRKAAYFIFQLCDALQYAHERGVVHRDLKPDNLMIEASPPGSHLEERVKILDFGIAKVANTTEHTGSGISMGTPRYMAPEQVTNAAAATSAADVFSLATIFYLVVTGALPWGMPESDVAIYHLQKTEAPAWPSEDVMQHDVAAVVMRALSIKSAQRPSMREFALEIAAAIPREGNLESGTEILQHVKRGWVKSSLPHAQTLPQPVAADPTASSDPLQHVSHATRDASPPAEPPAELAPSVTDLAITANVRRRSRGGAVGPAAVATVDSPLAGVSALNLAPEALPVDAARAERLERPPAPVLAALPTGLLSQRFAAQEPPTDARAMREESVIVAAEIDLASGTPGPQPYAHSDLPAVLVSNTQLSATPRPASTTVEPTARASEPPPVLVLPGAPHSARRKLLVLTAAACALMTAAVVYAVARRDLQAQQSYVSSPVDDRIGSAGSAVGSIAQDTGKSAIAITDPAQPPAEVGEVHPTAGADIRAVNAAEPRTGSAGSTTTASPAIDTRAPSSHDAGNATPTASPEQSAKHVPPPRDVSAKPGMVNARPAEPAAPDASSVAARSERRPDPSSNRSTEAQATTLRQPPSEAVSDKPPRVDAKRTGKLTILVTPWALVWLDGKPVDQAPVVVDDVPVGRHRLRLKNEIAKKDETTTVMVTAGQTTTVQRTW